MCNRTALIILGILLVVPSAYAGSENFTSNLTMYPAGNTSSTNFQAFIVIAELSGNTSSANFQAIIDPLEWVDPLSVSRNASRAGQFFITNSSGDTQFYVNHTGVVWIRQNLTIGTGSVHLDGVNNRLGIGTTNPNEALDVRGSASITGTLLVAGINITKILDGIISNHTADNATIQSALDTKFNLTGGIITGNVTIVGSLNVTVRFDADEIFITNITLTNGGRLWDNSTCTIISSPDGSTILEICDS